jgi:dolichol kinase
MSKIYRRKFLKESELIFLLLFLRFAHVWILELLRIFAVVIYVTLNVRDRALFLSHHDVKVARTVDR